MSRPAPPSGATPPITALTSDGAEIDLVALASEICARYRGEFPDEAERYGDAGVAWCRHDNQYLLAWAIQDARDGTVVLAEQAVWLDSVLAARDFPAGRLARDLQIAAEVVEDRALGSIASDAADRLRQAASLISTDH